MTPFAVRLRSSRRLMPPATRRRTSSGPCSTGSIGSGSEGMSGGVRQRRGTIDARRSRWLSLLVWLPRLASRCSTALSFTRSYPALPLSRRSAAVQSCRRRWDSSTRRNRSRHLRVQYHATRAAHRRENIDPFSPKPSRRCRRGGRATTSCTRYMSAFPGLCCQCLGYRSSNPRRRGRSASRCF
jgi:hypothetical protein